MLILFVFCILYFVFCILYFASKLQIQEVKLEVLRIIDTYLSMHAKDQFISFVLGYLQERKVINKHVHFLLFFLLLYYSISLPSQLNRKRKRAYLNLLWTHGWHCCLERMKKGMRVQVKIVVLLLFPLLLQGTLLLSLVAQIRKKSIPCVNS
jgi:hypothetical protein